MATIFIDYIYWHFSVAPVEILRIMKNYLRASWHQFLVVQHLKTLFSPWHRQNPSDFGIRDRTLLGKFLDSLADIDIRLIAAIIRLIIIITGIIWSGILATIFLLLFIAWMLWPILIIYMIAKGILIFNI